MSVLLLASAAHAPGVTSLAVALAVHGDGPALLVDANREPDQAVLAGYLAGADPGGRGLGGLLQAHRERRSIASALPSLTLRLEPDSEFLPGFSHPGMVGLFAPAWPELAVALEAQPARVIVDCGRVGPAGLPQALVEGCSGLLMVTGSTLPDLVALRLYLPSVLHAAGEDRVGLAVVGPGRPYVATEIQRQFGVPVWAELPWQPGEAAVYALGSPPGRRHDQSGYVDQVRALDRRLATRESDRRALLGVRR